MTEREILLATRDRLNREERWTQGAEGRDADGVTTWNVSRGVVSWCIAGALRLEARNNRRIYHPIEAGLMTILGCQNIIEWNDATDRKYQDIIDLLDIAIG